MPLVRYSWTAHWRISLGSILCESPVDGSGKRCHAEWSLLVAFDKILMERIFPVGHYSMMQMSGFSLMLGAWISVVKADISQLKLKTSHLLGDWVYNTGTHLGQGSNRSQIAQHSSTGAKETCADSRFLQSCYCAYCQKWAAETALHGRQTCRNQDLCRLFLRYFSVMLVWWDRLQEVHTASLGSGEDKWKLTSPAKIWWGGTGPDGARCQHPLL